MLVRAAAVSHRRIRASRGQRGARAQLARAAPHGPPAPPLVASFLLAGNKKTLASRIGTRGVVPPEFAGTAYASPASASTFMERPLITEGFRTGLPALAFGRSSRGIHSCLPSPPGSHPLRFAAGSRRPTRSRSNDVAGILARMPCFWHPKQTISFAARAPTFGR